jgi:hypothetical protein
VYIVGVVEMIKYIWRKIKGTKMCEVEVVSTLNPMVKRQGVDIVIKDNSGNIVYRWNSRCSEMLKQ